MTQEPNIPKTVYKTKLSLDQEAWFMRDNKPTKMKVVSVTIKHTRATEGAYEEILYGFRFPIYGCPDEIEVYAQSLCFATKEELLASL